MIAYRPHIDGLRAIAVISVILFHVGFSLFSGGFVGVDVFFVISGYLITSIIRREASSESFSYLSFYERRARRLLPPLIPVIIASSVLSFCLLDTENFNRFINSIYASVFFVANLFFWSTTSYFDGPGEMTPLLHLWSLGVEEQFYLIFPATLLLALKKGRRYVSVIPIIFIASFILSETLLQNFKSDAAFYNPLARFWELLAGALLALYCPKRISEPHIANITEIIGSALILLPILTYTKGIEFPGLYALPPVIGAMLIIATDGNGALVGRLLKSRALVVTGLISYSLYLWHWPVLVFLRLVFSDVDTKLGLLAILISFSLASLSYIFLETPFRRKKALSSQRAILSGAVATTLLVTLTGAVFQTHKVRSLQETSYAYAQKKINGDKAKVIEVIASEYDHYQKTLNLNYTGNSGAFDLQRHKGYTCSYDEDNSDDKLTQCLLEQKDNKINVLVLGDSIGRDTYHALSQAFPDTNFIMLHQSACPPSDAQNSCFRSLKNILHKISSTMKISGIVISFRYKPDEWTAVSSGIDLSKSVTANVWLFGASPVFKLSLADMVKRMPGSDRLMYVHDNAKNFTPWSYAKLADDAKELADKKGINFLRVNNFFCPSSRCLLWVNNEYGAPLYIDKQHLSAGGINALSSFLRNQKSFANSLGRDQTK